MGSRSAQTASSGRFEGLSHMETPKETSITPHRIAIGPSLHWGLLKAQSSYSPRRNAEVTLLPAFAESLRSPEKKAEHQPWSSVQPDPQENPLPAYPSPTETLHVTIFPSCTIASAGRAGPRLSVRA